MNAIQWNWKCVFFPHVVLKSRFNMMTIKEVTFDRPVVFPRFSVIFCSCRFRPFRVALKFFSEIFTPCKLLPHQSEFSNSVVSSKQFTCSICGWEYKSFSSPSWRYLFFSIEPSRTDFWRVQVFHLLNVRNHNVSFPNSPRSTHGRGIFQVKLSYQMGGALAGLLKKPDDI